MGEVSGAIIVLAGAILILTGSIASSATDASRQRIVGLGYLLGLVGLVVWLIGLVHTFKTY